MVNARIALPRQFGIMDKEVLLWLFRAAEPSQTTTKNTYPEFTLFTFRWARVSWLSRYHDGVSTALFGFPYNDILARIKNLLLTTQ